MKTLHITVVDKVATYQKRDGNIVCGNSDYQISFAFDSEWDAYTTKTARFIWGGKFYDVDFTGATCPVPIITNTSAVEVGVYAGELSTTTQAIIACRRSILCGGEDTPHEGSIEEYRDAAARAADRAEAAAASVEDVAEEAAAATASAEAAAVSETNAATSETDAEAAAEAAAASAAAAATSEANAAASAEAAEAAAAEAASAANVVQTTGDSETAVMSQAAVTNELLGLDETKVDKFYAVKTGGEILITDSTDDAFRSVTVHSAANQDGTPTLDNVVPVVSAGSGGAVTVSVDGQSLSISTPNGLYSVPVTNSEDANVEVSSGVFAAADYIDLTRGVLVQNTCYEHIDAITKASGASHTYKRFFAPISNKPKMFTTNATNGARSPVVSNKFTASAAVGAIGTMPCQIIGYIDGAGSNLVCCTMDDTSITTVADANAAIGSDGFDVVYLLDEPVETRLSAEEISAISSLCENFSMISGDKMFFTVEYPFSIVKGQELMEDGVDETSTIRKNIAPLFSFENGTLTSDTGAESNNASTVGFRLRTIGQFCVAKNNLHIWCPDFSYRVAVYRYTPSGVYLGYSGWLDSARKFALTKGEYIRLVVAYKSNVAITPASAPAEILISDEMPQITELPRVNLTGDISTMTKDVSVTLDYEFLGRTGTCEVKWQGSSSVRYIKKNYTLKFDEAFDAWALWAEYVNTTRRKNGNISTIPTTSTWGEQKKYCAKANWIDASHARNVVCARLWGQVVATRTDITDNRAAAPNYGAIDGFPCTIYINDVCMGLYTFNIPKDAWTFAMGDVNTEYVVSGEDNANEATRWKALAALDETDFSLEHAADDVATETVLASLNTAIQAAIDAGEDWETTLAPYVDINSVFDYFIFTCCISNHDALARNILYGTYDGTRWFMSAYDMDTTFGSDPYGTSWFAVKTARTQFAEAAQMHRLAYLVYTYSKDRLAARYTELRETVLSDANVWYELSRFIVDIPSACYDAEREIWSTIPGTSLANISQFMDYYRMHCAYLDKEIAALSGE